VGVIVNDALVFGCSYKWYNFFGMRLKTLKALSTRHHVCYTRKYKRQVLALTNFNPFILALDLALPIGKGLLQVKTSFTVLSSHDISRHQNLSASM
jgi:hypothetical protein